MKQFIELTNLFSLSKSNSALYSLGCQQGVLETVRNPRKIQQAEFENICMQFGVKSGDQIDIVWEKNPPSGWKKESRLGYWNLKWVDPNAVKDPRATLVANIGREIIRAVSEMYKYMP